MTHSYTNEIWDFLQASQTLIATIHTGYGQEVSWWASLGHLLDEGYDLKNRMSGSWEDDNQNMKNAFIATLNIIRFLSYHDGPELYIHNGFWNK